MPYTDFPNGITSLGVPQIGSGQLPVTGGQYIFFSSNTNNALGPVGGSGGDGSFGYPKATLVQALASAVASRGDVLVGLPGHAETISSATALAMSKANVSVIGLGIGAARPTFTLDTLTSAAIPVSAANCSFANCIFTPNLLSVATCFSLTTAKNFQIHDCSFRDTSSILNFLTIATIGAGANLCDGLAFNNNEVINLGVTSNNTTLNIGGTIDRAQWIGNNLKWAVQNDKPCLADVTTGILTNLDCGYNKAYRPNTTTAGGSLIKLTGTTSTGWVYNNYVQTLTTTSDLLFTTSVGLSAFNNYVTGVVGASGFLVPAADS